MNKFKEYREKVKMTQCEVANRLGIEQGTISMWETDKNYPSIKYLMQLAELYECTTDELLSLKK